LEVILISKKLFGRYMSPPFHTYYVFQYLQTTDIDSTL